MKVMVFSTRADGYCVGRRKLRMCGAPSARLDRVDIQKVTLRERIVEKLPRQLHLVRHPIKFIAEKLARFLILRTRIRYVLVKPVQRHGTDYNPSLARGTDHLAESFNQLQSISFLGR